MKKTYISKLKLFEASVVCINGNEITLKQSKRMNSALLNELSILNKKFINDEILAGDYNVKQMVLIFGGEEDFYLNEIEIDIIKAILEDFTETMAETNKKKV